MIMNTPAPYGRSTLDNSPLDASGIDFPCKLRSGVYDPEGASNVFSLGSKYPLSFTGQAVHGGGSCQVSLTYDTQPTKDSIWKAIKSIEGGCPAQDQSGNMGDNASVADPYVYEFTVPSNIPSGRGTIAWTWFNKIGNREMYMNCGPVILTGAGGQQSNFDALPDMFKANIGNDCGVPSGMDVVFPNPGDDVTKMNGATDAFATPTGKSCVIPSRHQAPTTRALPTTSTKITFTSMRIATKTTAVTSALSRKTSSTINRPQTTTTLKNVGDGEGSYSNSLGLAAGSPCFHEGVWHCIQGSQFQRCASGVWSKVQRLAAGTSCTPGNSTYLKVEPIA
jgi:hypothetical protein